MVTASSKMPTLILVDCGLSMGRLVGKREDKARPATQGGDIPEITLDDDTEIRHLAIQAELDILPKIHQFPVVEASNL